MLAEGKVPNSLAGLPFAVMRESVTVPGHAGHGWQWSILTSPKDGDVTALDRRTALRIIDANGMKAYHDEPCGQIYETPGQPFLIRYNRRKNALAS